MSRRVTARLVRAAVVAIGIALTAATLSMAGGTSSSAATSARLHQGKLHQGKGYAVAQGDFVGFYTAPNGAKVYCLSPRKALPATASLATVARYAGVSATASHQLAYALSRWGDATTAPAAAAESQLVNTIVGNRADVARRARQLPRSVASIVTRHLTLTRRFYGPYVTAVHTPTALLPGQSAAGSLVVTSASGHRLTGTAVVLHGSRNVSLPAHVRTGSSGVARFTYRVTDVGEVHIAATATPLAPTRLRVNHPKAGQQRMVSWSGAVSSHGSASFQRTPSGFANAYACTATCNGKPATTLRACAAASTYARRIAFHYEAKTTYLMFAAGPKTVCRSLSVALRDGDHVSAAWQYATAHGWSKVVAAKGSFDVDCPAVPTVAVTMGYDCTRASLTVGLARIGDAGTWRPLINSTRHRMVLVVNGRRRIYADRGQSATFTAAASCDSPTTYTVQAGVRRTDGSYNYGAVASLRTPGSPAHPATG